MERTKLTTRWRRARGRRTPTRQWRRVMALVAGPATVASLVAVPGATTPAHAQTAGACDVAFSTNEWNDGAGGFTASLTVTNLGDPMLGWTLTFDLPGNAQLTQGWSAVWSQTGQTVTAQNLDWNANVPTGGQAVVGFNGTGFAGAPAELTLNGTRCDDDGNGDDEDPPVPFTPLRELADDRGFAIGAAVQTGPLANEPQYGEVLAREFNAVTPENAMKWDFVQPSPGQFTWGEADAVMDAAEANDQTVHGHTLVWHNQTPQWVQNLPEAAMRAAMEDHIAELVGRYQGRIEAWDVVNEAFNEDGSLRNEFWLQGLGESYIAEAFHAARAADPDAVLYINDFNVEGLNPKSDALFELVRDLREEGVPIDGVGLQGHLILGQVPSSIQANIERFAELDVEVKITELDIRIQLPAGPNELAQQAADYRTVADACLAVAECAGITTWGFTDLHSWIPGFFEGQGAALPFDEDYNPKPAYEALNAALAETRPPPDPTPGTDAYTWRNVEIAGGGFVPGIIFNRTEPDLIYARTDIGGAYRWNEATQRWTALLDWVGWDQWGWTGVVSLATDPVDPDRLYVAAGTYTNDWDPNNAAILRSADRGESFEISELPFKLGGNMPGRGMGERLMVDPNDTSIVYLGAPEGNGLWRSTDFGETWSAVESFPNPGDYAEDPSDPVGFFSHRPGIVWVTFDERTGSPGSATQTIYAGVADKENTVYRTTDGGATWERLAGQPTGFMAHKGVLDAEAGFLYIATSDSGGPFGGEAGDVWRFDTASEDWERVSPIPSDDPNGDNFFGFAGLSVDRQNPDTVMVTGYSAWWPDTMIFRSTDSGDTWSPIWEWAGFPERTFRYTQDVSEVPWLTFGLESEPPVTAPKLGWMTESLEVDPHDSDRMMYGTGATIYGTTNLTDWDADGPVAIRPMVAGLEETAALDLISPPEGAPLLSALGDIGGFRHDDLDTVPSETFTQPIFGNTTSIDYAELAPSFVVRVGTAGSDDATRAGFSRDGGASWWQASSEPGGVSAGGTVAAAADGSRVVWSPEGAGVHVSTDDGASWTPSSGIPAGARVEADRVEPDTFYGVAGGTFYVSTDGGASFDATGATGLPAQGDVRFRAVPDGEGDVWLAGGSEGGAYGLWRSTDGGASFTQLADVDQGDTVGFGAPAPGETYPAVYTSARIDGVRGIFRSDDAGASWVRINDDDNQWAWTGAAITGDPRVYGRVYVATNGRGIQVGDLS